MQPLPVPWGDAHATQSAVRHECPTTAHGETLHGDDTTPLHHALMVEEHCHGEYPHPQ